MQSQEKNRHNSWILPQITTKKSRKKDQLVVHIEKLSESPRGCQKKRFFPVLPNPPPSPSPHPLAHGDLPPWIGDCQIRTSEDNRGLILMLLQEKLRPFFYSAAHPLSQGLSGPL